MLDYNQAFHSLISFMNNKITIIGAGMVGSTTAYSLLASNNVGEIALIDINQKLAHAQAMDLQHSVPFLGYTSIHNGTYADIKNSSIVIITCGAAQKPGETRLDLVKKNSAIIKDILIKVYHQNPHVIIIMVTNPVDILTHIACTLYPKNKSCIIGTGTILDSARFRFLLGEYLHINPQSVHAYIVGEHGDSEVPLWSTATVGNTPIEKVKKLSATVKKEIFEYAKNAAYAIIEGKQATYYAIATGVAMLVDVITHDKKTVLPVSRYINGEYGIRNVCLSMPAVIGKEGIISTIPLTLSSQEKSALKKSAKTLQSILKATD